MQVLLRSSRNAYSNVINFDAGSLVLFSEFSLDRTPVNDGKRRYNWKERSKGNRSLNGRNIVLALFQIKDRFSFFIHNIDYMHMHLYICYI